MGKKVTKKETKKVTKIEESVKNTFDSNTIGLSDTQLHKTVKNHKIMK